MYRPPVGLESGDDPAPYEWNAGHKFRFGLLQEI